MKFRITITRAGYPPHREIHDFPTYDVAQAFAWRLVKYKHPDCPSAALIRIDQL